MLFKCVVFNGNKVSNYIIFTTSPILVFTAMKNFNKYFDKANRCDIDNKSFSNFVCCFVCKSRKSRSNDREISNKLEFSKH